MRRQPITIAIADDHEIIRIGLEHIFASRPGMGVLAQYENASAVLQADLSPVDVLVLEMNMPGTDGTALVQSLAERSPRLKIVVFSTLPEEGFASRVLAVGAAAFLPKKTPPAELVAAIRTVHRGGQYLTERQQERLRTSKKGPHSPRHQALSAREFEILLLIAKGAKPTDIAKRLALKIGTVTTHVHRIKHKLGVRSLGDLVVYGHGHQLLGL